MQEYSHNLKAFPIEYAVLGDSIYKVFNEPEIQKILDKMRPQNALIVLEAQQ